MNNKYSAIAAQLTARKTVMSFTEGDSMKPLLHHKSTCVVITSVKSELKANDLPLYQRPDGQFVMHRIIKVDREFYYTRGDNRCGLEKVPHDWVIGIVTEIKRSGKTIKVTDVKYRLYVYFWNAIYPIRWIYYKIRSIARILWKKIKR